MYINRNIARAPPVEPWSTTMSQDGSSASLVSVQPGSLSLYLFNVVDRLLCVSTFEQVS